MNNLLARAGWHGICSTLKPPRSFISPKPRRLPERKRMTIALGILAKDGVVLAADTQETYAGIFKVDQSKITAVLNGTPKAPRGAFVVSGAGTAGHLDSIQQDLCEAFSKKGPKKIAEVRQIVRSEVLA